MQTLSSGKWSCGDGYWRWNAAAAFPVVDNVGPEPKTASYTITEADAILGKAFDNTGAGGAVTFTLPTPKKGMRIRIYKTAAQNVVVAAAAGTTINNAASWTDSTGGDSNVGYLEVTAITAIAWRITGREGTWS
jgi:hypothetical protein